MEGETGAVLRLCLDGWWLGWLCGKQFSSTEADFRRKTLMTLRTGCSGTEVHCPELPFPNLVFWSCQCRYEWIDYAEVCMTGAFNRVALLIILYSSVVLWVSQNMEDDYTYNLAL